MEGEEGKGGKKRKGTERTREKSVAVAVSYTT